MPNSKRPLIIGISGVTCGGKTSLCEKLAQNFEGSVIISQDQFFRDDYDPLHTWIDVKPGVRHQNWELLGSIDWNAFKAEIDRVINEGLVSENGFLIIEGHIILSYDDFPFTFDKKYFLTLSKEQCWQRRRIRTYIPNDPDGYFDVCIWPMYLHNKTLMESLHNDVVYIDGNCSKEHIFNLVFNDLSKLSYKSQSISSD